MEYSILAVRCSEFKKGDAIVYPKNANIIWLRPFEETVQPYKSKSKNVGADNELNGIRNALNDLRSRTAPSAPPRPQDSALSSGSTQPTDEEVEMWMSEMDEEKVSGTKYEFTKDNVAIGMILLGEIEKEGGHTGIEREIQTVGPHKVFDPYLKELYQMFLFSGKIAQFLTLWSYFETYHYLLDNSEERIEIDLLGMLSPKLLKSALIQPVDRKNELPSKFEEEF